MWCGKRVGRSVDLDAGRGAALKPCLAHVCIYIYTHVCARTTGAEALGIQRFYCKINEATAPSIAMFEGYLAAVLILSQIRIHPVLRIHSNLDHKLSIHRRLGYVRVNYVAAFKEIEFEFLVLPSDETWADKWRRLVLGTAAEGEGALMRRVPYVEGEEEEDDEGRACSRSRGVDVKH